MQIIAEQKNTRQSSRKVRLVANAVRKLSVKAAFEQLAVMERKASIVVAKVLRQAVANAMHNHRLTADQIEIENILVNEGPTYKRFRAVSRGRAHTIFKRTSHVRVVLKTKEAKKADKAPVEAKKEVKAEAKTEPKKETKKVVKKAKK
jgi:large subunit ribosomal protein L22